MTHDHGTKHASSQDRGGLAGLDAERHATRRTDQRGGERHRDRGPGVSLGDAPGGQERGGEGDAAAGQPTAQPVSCSCQPAADRVLGEPQPLRSRVVGQAFQVAEHDHRAKPLRQAVDLLDQGLRLFRALGGLVSLGRLLGDVLLAGASPRGAKPGLGGDPL